MWHVDECFASKSYDKYSQKTTYLTILIKLVKNTCE